MKKTVFVGAAILCAGSIGAAQAQTVGIGTTKGGATSQVSAGVATVVSKHAGLNMRTQPMAGTQQYIPAVNANRLEFGVANIMQTKWAWEGTSISKGRPNKNLRMVGTLMKFRVGPLVADKSPIKTMADLKGKKIPTRFSASPLFGEFMAAFLANANVSIKDGTPVAVSSLRQHWDALTEGKIDVVVAAVGTGYLNLMSQKLGGVRFLSMNDSPEALAATQKFLPGITIETVQPGPKLTGVKSPVKVTHFDYMLFASKDVKDEVVYKVAKALYENQKELIATSPLWRSFKPENMGKDQGMPFHPGAVKLLKEKGAMK
ncbi:MAG: TAXI family TRAP transporter solute-binding subunit [Hyphomicrobiales bacterium]|nr:TAXI family TRAP transporter solute-binding subunit [Hyphomicrobiales bacterium]